MAQGAQPVNSLLTSDRVIAPNGQHLIDLSLQVHGSEKRREKMPLSIKTREPNSRRGGLHLLADSARPLHTFKKCTLG
jgi:hypothetical protein